MILSDNEILMNHKMISPFNSSQVQPASYDVTLSDVFYVFENEEGIIDPYDLRTYPSGEHIHFKRYVLNPNEFVLGLTKETVTLPNNIGAMVSGRSSIGRLGIEIHQTAGWIDPGFNGQITLEIINNSTSQIYLYPDMRIGQLIFMNLGEPARTAYNGKYQNEVLPEPSRMYFDWDKKGGAVKDE